jgi:hypothetical protein
MLEAMNNAINIYKVRGLDVTNINSENQFKCLREDLWPAQLNVAAREEHIGGPKRSIRTIKERTRGIIHGLPYKRYTKLMVNGCITNMVKTLNKTIADEGISDHLTPSALITGEPSTDYNQLVQLQFGYYVQVHKHWQRTNTPDQQSVGAIALYPSGNQQGSWMFMSLETGQRIHRYRWTRLPISKEVIDRVNKLANNENQPLVATNFKYEWERGTDINDLREEE